MADLPIIKRADLSKVPQSIKDATNDVVFYKQLASYLFKYNIVYKANDVFVVDNDLGLSATGLIRTAADDHIPADILIENAKPTYTVDPATPSATVPVSSGRYTANNKNIGTVTGTTNANSIQPYPGGIAWITSASGSVWGNHSRAFDTGSSNYPVIAGVQAFTGGNGAATVGYTNIYYLGSSRVTYPLYTASMAFRALGFNCKGLGVTLTKDGFLQIAGGTIDDWYGEEIRVPQRSKAAFYYAHGQKILNSPVLIATVADLKRKDVNGTLTLLPNDENIWHFVYLDPDTLNVYIVLGSSDAVITGTATTIANSILNAIDAHSKTTIPDFLRENGILLASIGLRGGNNITTIIDNVHQLHNFVPGNGNALHPSIPDPNDYPEGGTLKAKDDIYQVLYDYDGYLISQATALKENHFFIYDKNVPKKISSIEYQGSKAPFTKILGLGIAPQRYDYRNPDNYLTYQYSWLDRANYPDVNEKGLYYGTYRVDYPVGNPPSQDAQIRALGGMATIDVDANSYIPVFFNAIALTHKATDYTYSTMSGCPKIPGINNGAMNENGVFRYDSALRAKRATQGSADSLLMLEATSGVNIYPDEQLNIILTEFGQPRDLNIIRQLVTLIGPSLAQQIKDTVALIKRAGMLGVGRTRVMTIVGYVINNISDKNSLEYSLPGVMGLLVNKNTGVVTLDPKYPIWIQPADINNLTVENVSPLQAVIIFLVVRFNYMSHIFGGLYDLRFTEMPLPTT